ncbi:MAG: aromatic ring-hydroxylating dioxygenase subunit alpha, partial [Gammaproteobacteria bacterium]|nr:aromatic ring-hydroxylating dioxygenase subunit alpha [Gammaproteobacteria bacterium]
IPNPGDYQRTTVGLQPVLFCRDQEHEVRVHFNRCRHRGATVCQQRCGNTASFRCEYHGWTYRLDGALTHVPYRDAYEDLDMSKLGLASPNRMESYRGFVFVSLAGTGASLADHLGRPAMEQIDYFCDLSPEGEILVQAGASLLAYDGNWKLQMENSIDGYHPNFTHQSFFQNVQRQTGRRVDTFDGDSMAQCRALGHGHALLDYRRRNLDPKTRDARLAAVQRTSWGRKYYDDMVAAHGKQRADEVILVGGTHMNIFPNLVVLGQQVRTIRPVRSDRTEVTLAPALLAGVPDELNTQRLRQYESFYSPNGGGIHDDIEMFNRMSEGFRCTQEPWLIFRRGLHREQQDTDGTIVGNITDEVSQRAMLRHWKSVMTEPG